MSSAFIEGVVTFQTNAHRNRAVNAVNQYIGTWNAANPTMPLTGSVTQFQYQYPVDADSPFAGTSQRAISINYQSPQYSAVEEAQRVILQDVNQNAYLDVISLGTGNIF